MKDYGRSYWKKIQVFASMMLIAAMVVTDVTPVWAFADKAGMAYEAGLTEEAELTQDTSAIEDTAITEVASMQENASVTEDAAPAGDIAIPGSTGTEEVVPHDGAGQITVEAEGIIQNGEFPKVESEPYDEIRADGAGDGTYRYVEAVDKVVEAARNWNGTDAQISVDISSYSVPQSYHKSFFSEVVNRNPDLFYIKTTYSYTPSAGILASFTLQADTQSYNKESVNTFNAAVDEVLSGVDQSWTDLQKLIYIHDYLVSHIDYDSSLSKFDAYDALVGHDCVCQGYSLAYAHLVNKIDPDFSCMVVTSDALKHAWNIVTLNGKKYYVDNTWDDPVGQYPFYCHHNNFLKSRAKFSQEHNSMDWRDAGGYDVYDLATGNEYDDPVWGHMKSTIPMYGNKGYYYTGGVTQPMDIYSYDFTDGTGEPVKSYPDVRWNMWGSDTGYWSGNYSHLGIAGSHLVITLPEKIYVISSDGEDTASYDRKSTAGYIYGGRVEGNVLLYDIYTNPPSASGARHIGRYEQELGDIGIIPVTGVSLNKTSTTLKLKDGETVTETLIAAVAPANATNKAVTWSSDKESVARVDQRGKITAVSAGEANITVTTEDGNKTASCKVTVKDKDPVIIPVTGVSLNKTSTTLKLKDGETVTETLIATVAPANAANKAVTWSSDRAGVARVDQRGKVTAVSAGEANITVTTEDGNKTASCKVTVQEKDPVIIPVTGVSLDTSTLFLGVKSGITTGFLEANVYPENASNDSVIWSSSNTSVVLVDAYGNLTGVAPGEAVITVTTVDRGMSASCRVIVLKNGSSDERKVHSIKYVTNGGINSPYNPTSYREGDKTKFLDPTRAGYDFAGWYATPKLTGNTIISTEFQAVDLTLYASWNKATYTVGYNYGYADPVRVKNPGSYTASSSFALKNPKRTGYTFTGWFDEDGSRISRIRKGSSGNLRLTAGWSEHTYNIRFAANGGTGSMETLYDIPYSEAFNLPANTYVRTGYDFAGWTLKKNGKGVLLENGSVVSSLKAGNRAVVTLYAKWNPVRYDIIYEDMQNGIMPGSYPVKHTYAKAVKLRNPKRIGYNFAGWYDNPGLTGRKLTRIPAKIAGDVTLYARWNPIQYTIKFNSNGGRGKMKPIKGTYDTALTATGNTFTRKNRTFAGWALSKNGPKVFDDNSEVINLRNKKGSVTLYAVWQ